LYLISNLSVIFFIVIIIFYESRVGATAFNLNRFSSITSRELFNNVKNNGNNNR
jgi:hypothetical protein